MSRPKTSIVRRALVQTDCAFWCVHDHLGKFVWLGLPTLIGLALSGLAAVAVSRFGDASEIAGFMLGAWLFTALALLVVLVLPLPCAVFAWKVASGEPATVGECYAWCFRRPGRMIKAVVSVGLLWLVSALLAPVTLGLLLVAAVVKTCVVPLVALFENERRMFQRAGRILGDDSAASIIGGLHLLIGLALGGLLAVPRLVLLTPALGGNLLDASWRPMIVDKLWIFETASAAVLLTAIAISWWVSLTLVYHDVRWSREGERLKRRAAQLRSEFTTTTAEFAGGPWGFDEEQGP